MCAEDITFEVLDAQGERVGIILPKDLDIEVSGLNSDNGSWTLRLDGKHPMVALLRTPGSSISADLQGLAFSGPTLPADPQSEHNDATAPVVIKGRAIKA